jgi:hypothetical protein
MRKKARYHQQEVLDVDYRHYHKRRSEAAINIQCVARGKYVRNSQL